MAKSPFLDAAERCDLLSRTIKERQSDATGSAGFVVDEAGPAAPEAAWARRFATHVFRPQRSEVGQPPLSGFFSRPANTPKLPELPQTAVPAKSAAAASGHIGSILGKAGPKRSLVGRFFRKIGN